MKKNVLFLYVLSIIFTGSAQTYGVEPLIPEGKMRTKNAKAAQGSIVADCRTQFNDAGYMVQLLDKGAGKWSMQWSEISNAGPRNSKTAAVEVALKKTDQGGCVFEVKSQNKKDPLIKFTFSSKDPHAKALSQADFILSKKVKIGNKMQNAFFPLDCALSEEAISKYVGCEKPKPKPLFQVVPKEGPAVFERTKPKAPRPLFDVQKKPSVENTEGNGVDSIEDERIKLLPD